MVPYLLLSGEVVSNFQLLMGIISIYNLFVKLTDMREEMQIIKCKVNLKVIFWWAGAFLGKSLQNIMFKELSCCNVDTECPRSVKADYEVRYLACSHFLLTNERFAAHQNISHQVGLEIVKI